MALVADTTSVPLTRVNTPPSVVGPPSSPEAQTLAREASQESHRPEWWDPPQSPSHIAHHGKRDTEFADLDSAALVTVGGGTKNAAGGFDDGLPRTPSNAETLFQQTDSEGHKSAPANHNATAEKSPPHQNSPYNGEGTDASPYVVTFLPSDTSNALRFAPWRKWSIACLVALQTLAMGFASSAFTGGIGPMTEYFDTNTEIMTLGVSLYVLGMAAGPLLWGPVGEMYGRQTSFLISYFCFVIFNIACALSQNLETLFICRFFASFFGSSTLANGGGVVADMFDAAERGLAMSLFAIAPFLGPVLGPIAGGFVGQALGWRACFYMMAIFAGVMYILCAFLVPETYAPVILRRHAAHLTRTTGQTHVSHFDLTKVKMSVKRNMWLNLSRPFLMLFADPVCFLFACWAALVYGTLYSLFGTFPTVYQGQRGWGPGLGGCAFIGIGFGMVLACGWNIIENRRYSKLLSQSPTGSLPPEQRLRVCLIGAPALPIGLISFAWSTLPQVHWSASIILSAPFGFGMFLVFVGMQTFLVDTYLFYAASVLAANSVLRSIFGAAFPMFSPYMYEAMGVQWATTLFGCLALLFVPIPWLFIRYGPRIRARSRFGSPDPPLLTTTQCSEKPETGSKMDV